MMRVQIHVRNDVGKGLCNVFELFSKNDLFPSSKIVQKGECKVVTQGEIFFVAFQMGSKQK
jgi:hypothetical protein